MIIIFRCDGTKIRSLLNKAVTCFWHTGYVRLVAYYHTVSTSGFIICKYWPQGVLG